jgi:hypothetical protein
MGNITEHCEDVRGALVSSEPSMVDAADQNMISFEILFPAS